jgi:ABC-type bacteriocin/lantibiotic exporter with double-glycine peptidase domain
MKLPGPLLFIRKLYGIFSEKQKTAFAWLVFFSLLSSVTDLLGLSFIIPVVAMVLSDHFYITLTHKFAFFSGFSKNELLLLAAFVFFVLIIAKNVFGLYVNRMQVKFTRNVYITSSLNMLDRIYNKPLPELHKNTSNELMNKLVGQQMTLAINATLPAIVIINEGIIFALTAIIMLLWNWQLFLLSIGIVLPIMAFFYYKVKTMIKTAGKDRSAMIVKLYSNVQEMIFGYTDIKIAGTEDNFKKRYERLARSYSAQQGKMDLMNFIPTRIIEIAVFLCILLILLYSVFVLQDLEKIITTITLFSVIAYRSIPSVNRFVLAANNINSAQYIFNDPDFVPYNPKHEGVASETLTFNDCIRFDNVSFHYPNDKKEVLANCSLEIKRGEKIGIIGKSGAGKSTLINNILGFLNPTSGEILVDEIRLSENNMTDWWKMIGYVRQDVFILNTTFMENIAIGETQEEIDLVRLKHAIRSASLEELVTSWSNGIETMLNEKGNNLSGGQKQRIAIARAIYKGAKVLIFDEATSSLDSKTEEEITNSIRELGHEDLTIIIIAHRYTSLKYCDKIYKLEQGRITASMSYSELLTEMA